MGATRGIVRNMSAFWSLAALAVLGLSVMGWGVVMLTTGRVPAGARKSFPTTRNVGIYAICNGTGTTLIALTLSVNNDVLSAPRWLAYVTAVLAGTIPIVGFLRYGPRGT